MVYYIYIYIWYTVYNNSINVVLNNILRVHRISQHINRAKSVEIISIRSKDVGIRIILYTSFGEGFSLNILNN